MKRILFLVSIFTILLCGALYTSEIVTDDGKSAAPASPALNPLIDGTGNVVSVSPGGECIAFTHAKPEEGLSAVHQTLETIPSVPISSKVPLTGLQLPEVGDKPEIDLTEDPEGPAMSVTADGITIGHEKGIKVFSPPSSSTRSSSSAAVVYFLDSRTQLESLCPGLQEEDYEEANIASGSVAGFNGPLDQFTNNTWFSPGDIEPGIVINTDPGTYDPNLAVTGPGFNGAASKMVMTNNAYEKHTIDFTPGTVNTVGLDVLIALNSGNVDIEVYGPGGLIATDNISTTITGQFWGIMCTDYIERIVLESTESSPNWWEGADNILFGYCTNYPEDELGGPYIGETCTGPVTFTIDGTGAMCEASGTAGELDTDWGTGSLYWAYPSVYNTFDVYTKECIDVTGFNLNFYNAYWSTAAVSIYYKEGTSVGFETSSSAWTLITNTTVTCQSLNVPSHVDVPRTKLDSGKTYGFLVFTSNYYSMVYHGYTGPTTYSNSELDLTTRNMGFYLWGSVNSVAEWIGTIKYETCADASPPSSYLWSIDCPLATIADPTSAITTLTIDAPPPCPYTCNLYLDIECPTPPPTPSPIALTNAGFEAYTPTYPYYYYCEGWTEVEYSISYCRPIASHYAYCYPAGYGYVYPQEGSYMLRMQAQWYAPSWHRVYQEFTVTEVGQELNGWAFFHGYEYGTADNDRAEVIIRQGSASGPIIATPWDADMVEVGYRGCTGWETWNWTASATGIYVLEYRIQNGNDTSYDSYALFDMAELGGAGGIENIAESDMAADIVCEQYEDCSTGPVAGTAPCIISELGLSSVSLLGDFYAGDAMGSGAFGNALCSVSDTLSIVPPGGAMDNLYTGAGFQFNFPSSTTPRQFAMRMVDQVNHTTTFKAYSGGVLIAQLDWTWSQSGFPVAIKYFECSEPFDRLEVVAPSTSGGWCIDNLCFAGFGPPTPPGHTILQTTVSVGDFTAPTVYGVPADITVECDSVPTASLAGISATDNCDPSPTLSVDDVIVAGPCADTYTINRQFKAEDDCLNVGVGIQVIEVQDTTNPLIFGVPGPVTVECDAIPDPAPVTAWDNCDTDVELVLKEYDNMGGPCTSTEIQTYATASSNGGGSGTYGPQNANDGVGGYPTSCLMHWISAPNYAAGDYFLLTWSTPQDICAIYVDTKEIANECGYNTNRMLSNAQIQWWNGTSWVTDGEVNDLIGDWQYDMTDCITTTQLRLMNVYCSAAYGFQSSNPVLYELYVYECGTGGGAGNPCDYILTREWTATDNCENYTVATQELNVVDTTPPVLYDLPDDITIECSDPVPDPPAVYAIDNCQYLEPPPVYELTTIFAQNNGYRGNSFDITANECLTVTSFDCNFTNSVGTTGNVSMWYRTGTANGYEGSPAGWILLGTVDVTCQGSNNPTPVDIGGLTINAGETYGIYFYSNSYPSARVGYTNGFGTYSNAEMTVDTWDGIGASSPFGGSIFSGRIWNGTVHYEVCDPPPPAGAPVVMTESIEAGDCLDEYTLTRTWTSDDGCGNIAEASRIIEVVDTTAPVIDAFIEQMLDDEDEEIEGLFRILYSAEDNCDPDPMEMGFVNIWGLDENCDDEDPDFIGYEAEVGDIVQINCKKKFKPPCWANDEETDEEYEPDFIFEGPAFKLTVVAEDRCGNQGMAELHQICPDPKNCIFALRLKNTMDEEKTFYWFEFTGSNTLFEVGGEYGEFHTSCSQCLEVGDTSGDLTIVCIQTGYGSKLTKKCYVPEDYYMAPCPE